MEERQQCRSSLCIYRSEIRKRHSALPPKTVLPRAKAGRPEDLTERTGNSRLGPREGYKNGKVKTYPPPPLRSSSLSQGDKGKGGRKSENGSPIFTNTQQ